MIDGKFLVHLRAPVQSLSGYGVHARQIYDYLMSDERFIVCLESIRWGECSYIHNDSRLHAMYQARSRFDEAKNKNIPFDISVHVTIPNEFSRTAKFNIGVTAGIEVDRCSVQWLQKCQDMDLIVVPSEFSKNVLTKTVAEWKNTKTNETGEFKITKPIVVIPEWFEHPEKIEPTRISKLKFSSDVNLLHVGQWGNKGGFGEDRKNIADMVRYFYTFFKDNNVGLVLKANLINNSEEDLVEAKRRLDEIKANFKDVKCKVYLLHDTLSNEEMYSLYTHPQIIGLLSLTHGEGYGLPLLEAASCGLPVLATGWSGHLDFLRPKHGFIPLEYEMVEIPECQIWENVIDKGSKWAKVEEKDLKRRLKKFVDSPSVIIKQAKENVSWIKENFSKEVVLNKWKEFFNTHILSPVVPGNSPEAQQYKSIREKNVDDFRKKLGVVDSEAEKVLYIMPRSTGDVLISTAIVDSLIQSRHSDSDFYFATEPQYQELLEGFPGIKVIDYCDEMMNNEVVSQIFDVVYNPGINVQYNFSNWRLGNGQYAIKLLPEFAKNCNLFPSEITNYKVELKECSIPEGKYATFTPGGSKDAKDYQHWDDVIANIKKLLPDLKIVQTGLASEKLYNNVVDGRGKTLRETMFLIKNAQFHFGVDTFTAHAAAAVQTPHLVLYGSTDTSVSPVVLGKKTLGILVESTDRNGCESPCFKDSCFNRKEGRNCISNIDPKSVVNSIQLLVEKSELDLQMNKSYSFEESYPTISAYTTVLNGIEGKYPFEEAIRSFSWADEVIVVDGGSTDGTRDKLNELAKELGEKLKIYDMPIDMSDPGKDGAQKALARAMCMYEFCVQFDADEVCGKDCDVRFKKLAKQMPANVDLVSCPIYEFWGPAENWNLRTDRHIWKWRLSRNKPEITHGIPLYDRVEIDGKVYSKGGSDGCFPVNIINYDMVPNCFPGNWFNKELEQDRVSNLKSYGEKLKSIFGSLPYVKHYSWTDIEHKLRMLRGPWNQFWCHLYNKDPDAANSNDYFDVAWKDVTDKMLVEKSKELLAQGGQSPAPLLHLMVE